VRIGKKLGSGCDKCGGANGRALGIEMYHVLRSALPDIHYHSGDTVISVQDGPDQATITLSDGSVHYADIVFAADGFKSAIRERLLPDVKLEYAGYVAWRGLVDGISLSQQTREALFEKFAFSMPPLRQSIMLSRDRQAQRPTCRPSHAADPGMAARHCRPSGAFRAQPQ
jgi:2-polyprenyl-6-methoxyphenol hydroxylase and related FAD-dependent oxidoreductases